MIEKEKAIFSHKLINWVNDFFCQEQGGAHQDEPAKAPIFSLVEQHEQRTSEQRIWQAVLGSPIEVKPLPPQVGPEVRRNLDRLGLELRYIPKLNLGTLDALTMGTERFLQELEKSFPKWRRYEGLNDR